MDACDTTTEPDGDPASRPMAMQSEAMSVYKPDWREARDRMIAWWATGQADRVVAKVSSPKAGAPPRQTRGSAREQATDLDIIFDNLDRLHASTWYGAESFPMHFIYLAPATMGVFLGAPLEFRDESAWQGRLPLTWDQADQIAFDPDNRWWRFMVEQTRTSCQRSQGRYIVTVSGGGALADVMVNLLGCEETLLALIERPADVLGLRDRMLQWALAMNEEVSAILRRHQFGSADWLRMWAPGIYHSTQCDLCVMLSPKMFNDFFLEEIRQECRHLDYSLYHLDGVAAVRHLDALLGIEELGGIQWNPEPQFSDPLPYVDVFRRVQERGKKLFISCPPARIRPLLGAIGKENVFLSTICKDEPAAREVVRDLERIGL